MLARSSPLRERYRERVPRAARRGARLHVVLRARLRRRPWRDVPMVNARIDGDDIVYHRHVHLGVAVSTRAAWWCRSSATPTRMRFAELERAIDASWRARAREGKLTPDDLAGGTFTITNGGVFGSLLSTPILNPPQSRHPRHAHDPGAPVAVDGQVVIRPMMYVALSYDHRLVDGEQAVTFLVRVKERLEDPARMLLEV